MKNKKIILAVVLILYLTNCFIIFMFSTPYHAMQYSPYRNNILSLDSSRDLTYSFNSTFLKIERNDAYSDPRPLDLTPYNHKSIYITNKYDIKRFLKINNITNKYNVDYTKTKYNLPISNPDYKILLDSYNKEKKEPKILGTGKNGFAKFDIAPDAIILEIVDNNIESYMYIDSRLIDARKVMNLNSIDLQIGALYKTTKTSNAYSAYTLDFYSNN